MLKLLVDGGLFRYTDVSRHVLAVMILVIFSGCESLAPKEIKNPPKPSNLEVVSTKGVKEYSAVKSEPLPMQAPKPPEIYPAKGNLLGPNGAQIKGYSAAVPQKQGNYTLNFVDADIAEVAKTILDDALKLNYVINPKVVGKVTMQTARPLTDEELLPTLENLLQLNGAVLLKDPAGYKIEPDGAGLTGASSAKVGMPGQKLPSGYQLRVIPLRYVGAQEMSKILEPLMPPKSIVKVDAARNMLLVAGTSEQLQNVMENVQLFDADFMQGMSVGIYPVTYVEPSILAFELEKVLGDTSKGPLAGILKILPIERMNAILVMSAQPRYLHEAQTWIGRLDRYTSNRMGAVHVYRLQNVDATEMAKTLANIFGTNPSGGPSRPSLAPGSQGVQMAGSAYAAANSVTNSSGDAGSSTAGDLGMGASNGGLDSGPAQGSGFQSSGAGMNSGMTSSSGMGGGSMTGASGGSSTVSGAGIGGLPRSSTNSRSTTAVRLGGAKIVADPINNALIITAKAQEYLEIESVIRELDTTPKQVLIDVTVAEVQLVDALQYGLKWYFQQGSNSESLNGNQIPLPATANPLAFQYSLIMAGSNVRVLLSAQADKGKVAILSSPSVLVLNNQEAAIKVGDQVPILTGQYGNFTGGAATSPTNNPVYSSYNSVQYRDTGVLLNVRPRINSGGLVSMDIIQAVDDVKNAISTGSSGNANSAINSPTITQRQIKSSVAVHDGETLVLGGLIKDNNTLTRSGLPFLYELPVVGDLFGSTAMANTRTELVVLLTPRIVESTVKGREITNEFRRKLNGIYQDEPETEGPIPNTAH